MFRVAKPGDYYYPHAVNMPGDKYSAVWVSHTSISDYLACPRAYYLKNIYRDPKTHHKIKLISPPLALGQVVHEVVEALSLIPSDKRFNEPLMAKFDEAWKKISGKFGGFPNPDVEELYKERGRSMLRRIMNNPGALKNLAVKIKMDLPHYWLSEEDNIILCGKIDWLEYFPDTDSVHIIDFKTSKHEESEDSLQLPIYHLLVANCQKRKASKASYWYLNNDDACSEKKLPDLMESQERVLKLAKQIKLARQLDRFKCPHENGCRACKPYEAIIRGEATFVGVDGYNYDVYILDSLPEQEEDSIIL